MELTRALIALAMTLAVAGCGVDGPPRAPTATGEPVEIVTDDSAGGTLGGL